MLWGLGWICEVKDNWPGDYFSGKKFTQCGQIILNISCYILKQLHGEFYCTEKVLVNGSGGLAQHGGGSAALIKNKIKVSSYFRQCTRELL